MIDRVEISIIEESQPRWLAFLNGEIDLRAACPLEFANQAVPNGKLAPNLAKRGIQMHASLNADRDARTTSTWRIRWSAATRRRRWRCAAPSPGDRHRARDPPACGAARRSRRSGPVAPGTYGYDPNYKSENSDYDPARAKALLDMYGYVDRDGDGWREQPDGKPLVIEYADHARAALAAQFDELWKKNMDAIGVRLQLRRSPSGPSS